MVEVFLVLTFTIIFFVMSLYISPDEMVARFSFDTKHVSRPKNKKGKIIGDGKIIVRAALFDPWPKDNKASVSRISGIDNRSIWFIGKVVEKIRKENGSRNSLKGRADIKVSKIQEAGLMVVPDEPPPKHANIEGYKSESEEFHAQQILARFSTGYLVQDENSPIDNILNEKLAISKLFKNHI